MKKIVDVSGYGHSGKTAISEYLKDYEDVFTFPSHVEFELFRVQGGLLDLYLSIYDSWNLIRSRVRIIEFKKLIYRIGIVQNKYKLTTLWNASGHGYNQYFNYKFIDIFFIFKNIYKFFCLFSKIGRASCRERVSSPV